MREIKFRAWDKDIKVWFYWNLRDPFSVTWKMGLPRNLDSKSIGQYTGLKDKNGKEIYEGDILRVFNWGLRNKNLIGISKVYWGNEQNGWDMEPNFTGGDRYDLFRENYEVIGNIYENPDLLNK